MGLSNPGGAWGRDGPSVSLGNRALRALVGGGLAGDERSAVGSSANVVGGRSLSNLCAKGM